MFLFFSNLCFLCKFVIFSDHGSEGFFALLKKRASGEMVCVHVVKQYLKASISITKLSIINLNANPSFLLAWIHACLLVFERAYL